MQAASSLIPTRSISNQLRSHVFGSIEDECCFSSLSFPDNKLQNALDEHLPLVVGMYSQKFYSITNFPSNQTFDQ